MSSMQEIVDYSATRALKEVTTVKNKLDAIMQVSEKGGTSEEAIRLAEDLVKWSSSVKGKVEHMLNRLREI